MGYLLLHSGQPTAKRILRRITLLTGVESMDPVTSQDRVIRWGNMDGSEYWLDHVLNVKEAIQSTRTRQQMLSILQMNGLRCPLLNESGQERQIVLSRHYRVPVFNMRALSMYRSDGKSIWLNRRISQINQHFREVSLDEDRYAVRVTRLAVRAVHALGLDFGLVSLGITPRGFAYVLDVSPAPALKDKLLDEYVEAIRNWIKINESPVPANFVMGTDLEFMLRNREGKMVLASKFLPRQGKVGCDALSIGRDGRRFPLAEIRPEPTPSPLRLVKNIEESLREAKQLIPGRIQWLAGSMPFQRYGIGGHIHFSDIPLSSRLVKALDNYLALPVMMIEDSTAAARRRPKYGFLGDVRIKNHGGWEYRTLGSWLVSPEISKAVLCLAHLVAVHHRELNQAPLIRPNLQKAFYQGEKETLRPYFEEIWRDLQQTNLYNTYKEHLNVLWDMANKRITWNESMDIKRAWGIRSLQSTRTETRRRT